MRITILEDHVLVEDVNSFEPPSRKLDKIELAISKHLGVTFKTFSGNNDKREMCLYFEPALTETMADDAESLAEEINVKLASGHRKFR